PLQDELVAMLADSPLPLLLKSEMLADFKATAVMTSTESITYGDTQRQLALRLSRMVRTRVEGPDGTATTTTAEEYVPAESGPALGIYISPVNMHVANLAATEVAAYTQLS